MNLNCETETLNWECLQIQLLKLSFRIKRNKHLIDHATFCFCWQTGYIHKVNGWFVIFWQLWTSFHSPYNSAVWSSKRVASAVLGHCKTWKIERHLLLLLKNERAPFYALTRWAQYAVPTPKQLPVTGSSFKLHQNGFSEPIFFKNAIHVFAQALHSFIGVSK